MLIEAELACASAGRPTRRSSLRSIVRCRPTRLLLGSLLFILVPAVAQAQASPAPYTSATRYDVMGRVTGTIAPDPDGAGPLKHAATRTTYDAAGRPVKIETGELSAWQSETIVPASWTGFAVHTILDTSYDAMGRKLIDKVSGKTGSTVAPVSLTQYSYDAVGRLECTAVRMNPASWGSLPASACTLGAQGSYGPDRITKNVYDGAGQLVQVRKAVGTSIEIAQVTYSYTLNGKQKFVIDANGNRAELRYDGFDRQVRWVFPSKTRPSSYNDATPATALSSAGALNEGDYEAYTYDANGNRLTLRKRDGATLGFQYDALNRVTHKAVPERSGLATIHTRDVYYAYDLRGLQTGARFGSISGVGTTYDYDGFGRLVSETQSTDGTSRTASSQYDANGNRTRVTHPDGHYWQFDHDGLDRETAVRYETTVLGVASFNARGLLSQRAWTYGTPSDNSSSFGYDAAGRLASIALDLDGTASDVSWTYTRNPASQILTETRSNDAYSWDGHVNLARSYATNGLNQYTSAGSAAFCYDANGNLTADGTSVYRYDVENRLVERRVQTNTNCAALSYSGALEVELRYDPTGRLYQVSGGPLGTQRFVYDGNALIAEYNASGTLLRRYVHGPNTAADDPLIVYEGAAISPTTRRYLHADPRGSIVAVANHAGTSLYTNAYDEYGIPDSDSGNDIATKGRFRYTGQMWIPELGMYHYKARAYSPTLGRFMQTDPIGYEDQWNLYAYVANDPVNNVDPTGKSCVKNEGGSYSCKVDANSGKFSDKQIKALNATYTGAVNRLASRPNKSVTITVGDKSIKVKASQVVGALARAHVDTRRAGADDNSNASTAGGALLPEYNRLGRSVITVTDNVFKRPGSGYEKAAQARRTWVHEGIHAHKTLERPFFDQYRADPDAFNDAHQGPYDRAEEELLGENP